MRKIAKLFANSGDPDQTTHTAVSDLGLQCLPVTLGEVSRLNWFSAERVYVIDCYQVWFSIGFLNDREFC